jgi:hypothetical protein
MGANRSTPPAPTDWSKLAPQPVDRGDIAFGRIAGLLPPMDAIPEEFRRRRGPFVELVS